MTDLALCRVCEKFYQQPGRALVGLCAYCDRKLSMEKAFSGTKSILPSPEEWYAVR